MRNCYIRLDELYSKVIRAEESNNSDLVGQLESEYANNLLQIENHTDYDYLCLRYSLRKNKNTTLPTFKCKDYACFYWAKLWRVLLIILILLLPLIIVFLLKTV